MSRWVFWGLLGQPLAACAAAPEQSVCYQVMESDHGEDMARWLAPCPSAQDG
jgi:hypothetical protein